MTKRVLLIITAMLSLAFMQTVAVHATTKQTAQKPASSPSKPNFVGAVVNVDLQSRIMTLRNGRNLINFDISNAVLKGFGSLTDIKKGQTVGVRYLPDAIHVEKTTASAAPAPAVETAEKPPTAKKPQTTKKPQFARRVKTDGLGFSEVDNNKDGYISPVELCVVIPSLTMEQFRQYDTNHDGRLDKAEFGQVKLK
jgi:hypothetical protein